MEKKKVRNLILVFIVVLLALLIAYSLGWGGGIWDSNDDEGNKNMPGNPVFTQYVTDCKTGDQVIPNTLIQPDPGCDSWAINRYERPFNAGEQDEFYPELDIIFAELGKDSNWFYLSLTVFDPPKYGQKYKGAYGVEIDIDRDGRGDVLILAQSPGSEGVGVWSKDVQVWKDSNNDVGNKYPEQPDLPYEGDSYDLLVFDQGEDSDPDAAWVRVVHGEQTYIDIAFKPTVIDNADVFKWWAWADAGTADNSIFDYHDAITNFEAGDAYQSLSYFPANEIFAVDSTCAELWGAKAPADDPSYCINDPYIPGDTPGDRPTPTPTGFMGTKEWTDTPTSTVPTGEYVTLTPTETSTGTSTGRATLTGTLTATATETATATYTRQASYPTWTDEPNCRPNMNKKQCEAAGGTWVNVGAVAPVWICQCP